MTPDTIMDAATIKERIAHFGPLKPGSHAPNGDACVMEVVAFVAGEPWSDAPKCTCPVLSAFMRVWNDGLPDDAARDELLRPLIPRLIGTRGNPALERRRATMAADWVIRSHTVPWLRLAKLDKAADAVSALPEITDFAQCSSLMPVLNAARSDADVAMEVASIAAWAAAMDVASTAARDAARDAAWAAAKNALASIQLTLQKSALELVERMIAAEEPADQGEIAP